MNDRIMDNSIKGLLYFMLFIALAMKSCTVSAQTSRESLDTSLRNNVQAWQDSVNALNSRTRPVYIGLECSIALPQYILQSNIPQLNGLTANFLGGNVGGVLANPVGKLKASAGIFYSESNVPRTIDLLQGNLSGSIYLLRMKRVKYHTFEPYLVAGVSHQQSKYYGTYLHNKDERPRNYSTTQEPSLGKTNWTQVTLGTGVEFQLESDNNSFVHLFAEIGYGMPIQSSASNKAFSATTIPHSTWISIGTSFGKIE